MKKQLILSITAILFVQIAFSQIADKVITNAKIYTANISDTFAEALAIKDGLLIYVGAESGVANHIGTETEILNAQGNLILPGFHDVHIHPLEASSINGATCFLDSQEIDPENFISVLLNCNSTPNSNGWILGFGHSIFTLLDATRAPKEILDDVFPTTPALIMEETSHSMWINSAGLDVLGITAATPDPVGGHIVKTFWGNNSPDGILLDSAGDDALQVALETNTILETNNYNGLVEFGLPLLARNGITSISEGRTYWKQNYIETWNDIKNNGELTCRVVLAPWVYPADNDATQIPILQNLFDEGDAMLRVSQIKLYSDGITINATAALHDPYIDNLGFPFTDGLNYIDEARMTNLITTLELIGYDFHIHAIGDRGITESLNAIETARNTNGNIGARHRVTHLEIVRTSDFNRFSNLNVTADIQVTGDFTNPENWHDNDFLIGAARAENMIPLKFLYDSGARITLSSDWDVSSLNPFVGIQNSLTRAPQELPNIETAIKSYTINGAYVMRQENITGSLEINKYADLVMVDRDVFTIPVNQISESKILLTWLAGEEIFRDETLSLPYLNNNNTKFLVYPAVTNKNLHVYFNGNPSADSTLNIYDYSGKKVIKTISPEFNPSNRHEITLDVSSLSEGVYIIKLQLDSENIQFIKRFIVSK